MNLDLVAFSGMVVSLLWVATWVSSAAAFSALLGEGHLRRQWPMTMLATVATVTISAGWIWPHLWTDEHALMMESTCALFAVLVALRAVRFDWPALAMVLCVAGAGFVTQYVPAGMRWGYRGLGFVDLAATLLLAGAWATREEREESVTCRSLAWLALIFGARTAMCGAWELSEPIARAIEGACSVLYCAGMIAIAQAALNHQHPPSRTSSTRGPVSRPPKPRLA